MKGPARSILTDCPGAVVNLVAACCAAFHNSQLHAGLHGCSLLPLDTFARLMLDSRHIAQRLFECSHFILGLPSSLRRAFTTASLRCPLRRCSICVENMFGGSAESAITCTGTCVSRASSWNLLAAVESCGSANRLNTLGGVGCACHSRLSEMYCSPAFRLRV